MALSVIAFNIFKVSTTKAETLQKRQNLTSPDGSGTAVERTAGIWEARMHLPFAAKKSNTQYSISNIKNVYLRLF